MNSHLKENIMMQLLSLEIQESRLLILSPWVLKRVTVMLNVLRLPVILKIADLTGNDYSKS